MRLWKPTQVQAFETLGSRKRDYHGCFVQFMFLESANAKPHGDDIDAAPSGQCKLSWLDAAIANNHSFPRYEALQESLKDGYTPFVVEKERLALIKTNIAMLYREAKVIIRRCALLTIRS